MLLSWLLLPLFHCFRCFRCFCCSCPCVFPHPCRCSHPHPYRYRYPCPYHRPRCPYTTPGKNKPPTTTTTTTTATTTATVHHHDHHPLPSPAGVESDGDAEGAGDGQQQRQQQEGKEEGERGEGEEALISGVRGDSDFDGLLLSYLEGRLGEAGGSLLMPLGALRLLRWEGVGLGWFSGGWGLGERGRRAGKVVLRLWDLESIEAGGSLGGGGVEGAGCTLFMYSLSLKTILGTLQYGDRPRRIFTDQARHHVHHARSAVRCSASRMKGELQPFEQPLVRRTSAPFAYSPACG